MTDPTTALIALAERVAELEATVARLTGRLLNVQAEHGRVNAALAMRVAHLEQETKTR